MHGGANASLEIAAREALDRRALPQDWPDALRARYQAERAASDFVEGRFLTKVGLTVTIVSAGLEAFVLPDQFWTLILARLLLVVPLQLAALACPIERVAQQKVLMVLSLVIFGAIILRASLWAPWPLNAYMAIGPVSLFGVALPLLPLGRREQWIFAIVGFGILAAMAFAMGEGMAGRETYLTVAGLTVLFSRIIGGRYHLLAERSFLFAVVAEERLRSLSESNRLLAELSRLDPLTSLSNRRHALDRFASDFAAPAPPSAGQVAMILLDIDHFKAFNDRWGHQRGDECLVAVAERMQSCAERHGGLAARYGGEEFLILLRVADASAAARIADDLRRGIEQIEIACDDPACPARCSASLGLALHCGPGRPQFAAMMARADDALYRAKKAGRNRIMIAP